MKFDEIKRKIENYRREYGKSVAKRLYIGITNDVERRLFGFHRVPRRNYWWIYLPADDDETARRVERHFIEAGMQGGAGGGNENSKIVYCYEVSTETREN